MKTPKVLVALSEKAGSDILLVTKSDGGGVVHEVHWTLERLEKEGYMGACEMVGNAILRMLASPHEQAFQQYPLLLPPKPLTHEPYFMVIELIQISIQHKTKVYVSAIDDLLNRFASEVSSTNLPRTWPRLRDAILLNAE